MSGSEDEGTLIFSSDNSLGSPRPCLPEQGSWKRIDVRTFIASNKGFCYTLANNTLTPFGHVTAHYRFTMSSNGETLSGTGYIAISNGPFSDTFTFTAVGQHPHPPAP